MAGRINDLITDEEREWLLSNDPYEDMLVRRGFYGGFISGVVFMCGAITLGYWWIWL